MAATRSTDPVPQGRRLHGRDGLRDRLRQPGRRVRANFFRFAVWPPDVDALLDSRGVQSLPGPVQEHSGSERYRVASGLEVTGDGTGIVSHAGLGLVHHLADKTGLTEGLSQALFSGLLLHHDQPGVADSHARSRTRPRDQHFRVLAHQAEAFGQSRLCRRVPDAGGHQGRRPMEKKLTAAVSAARRYAWAQVVARHGTLPGCGSRTSPCGRDVHPDRRDRHPAHSRKSGPREFQRLRSSPLAVVL